MNLRLSLLLGVLIFVSCSNDDDFRGSGKIISEGREVASFTKIDNSTSINITLLQGTAQEMQVSADDNIINEVQTIVKGGVLTVGFAEGNFIDITVDVTINIPNLEGLENSGSGNIAVSGFGNLTNLSIDNVGSGSITISGSGTTLALKNSGSGSYKGFGFVVENCSVTNSGSGDCQINCTDSLEGTNSGSGSVFYKGGSTVDIANTGSGQVVKSN